MTGALSPECASVHTQPGKAAAWLAGWLCVLIAASLHLLASFRGLSENPATVMKPPATGGGLDWGPLLITLSRNPYPYTTRHWGPSELSFKLCDFGVGFSQEDPAWWEW